MTGVAQLLGLLAAAAFGGGLVTGGLTWLTNCDQDDLRGGGQLHPITRAGLGLASYVSMIVGLGVSTHVVLGLVALI